jgi:NAD(P)-dependent dehydrogenase (short-subunit alcohol dehydrogenase family)
MRHAKCCSSRVATPSHFNGGACSSRQCTDGGSSGLDPARGFGLDLEIKGLRVLVTAGGAGIGREIVEAFVREGAEVFTCDLSEVALGTLGPAVGYTCTDVSNRVQVGDMMKAALVRLGGLDVLINNAGIAGPTGKVDEIAPEEWDRCVAVCLTGQFNCVRLAVPHLRSGKNPSIVNISSLAGQHGFALRTAYSAAKWGVIGLTKSLAIELGEDGIRVNAILPGLVQGDRQRRVLEAKAEATGVSFEEMERLALSFTSIKKYVTPRQIADQILFLCSPRSSTVSGQAIVVDGYTRMLS